jgi:hypothetical protein
MHRKALPEAQLLRGKAKAALLAHRDGDALELFKQAYCVFPDPEFHREISSAELGLGRCAEALEDARSWVEQGAQSEHAEAMAWRSEVERQCGEVAIDSVPSAAELHLDGASEALGRTPWQGWLRAGIHTVVASKPDFLETPQQIDVTGGSTGRLTVSIALLKPPVVESTPAGPAAAAPPLPVAEPVTPVPTAAATPPAVRLLAVPRLAETSLPESERVRMSVRRETGIAGIVVGVAAVGAGAACWAVAQGQLNDAKTRPPTAPVQTRLNGINALTSAAIALFASGGAVVTGGSLAVAF